MSEGAERELNMHRHGNLTVVAQACSRKSGRSPAGPRLEPACCSGLVTPLQLEGFENVGLVEGSCAKYIVETGEETITVIR